MSQENAEIVRRFYEAWARKDPGPNELMDPAVEYVNPAGAIEPGVRRGRAAFSKAVKAVFDGWEIWQAEPERLTAAGDHVVVVLRYRARGRGSGVEIEKARFWDTPGWLAVKKLRKISRRSPTPGARRLREPSRARGRPRSGPAFHHAASTDEQSAARSRHPHRGGESGAE